MNAIDIWWSVAAGLLMVGGLGPALVLVGSGPPRGRIVGLQLAGSVTVLLLMVVAALLGQPTFLLLPLVLVLVSFAGTLVFTRLLGPDP